MAGRGGRADGGRHRRGCIRRQVAAPARHHRRSLRGRGLRTARRRPQLRGDHARRGDLAVREVGPEDARLTVVFAHGFCLRMGAFHFQRARLAEQWGPQVRMVFYDQRGPWPIRRSPTGDVHRDAAGPRTWRPCSPVMAPRGPVVLVGHSMGGMTVLSHARQFPQRYPHPHRRRGDHRVCGRRGFAVAAGRDPEEPGAGGGCASRSGTPRRRCTAPAVPPVR